jgi:hypothetical protein
LTNRKGFAYTARQMVCAKKGVDRARLGKMLINMVGNHIRRALTKKSNIVILKMILKVQKHFEDCIGVCINIKR